MNEEQPSLMHDILRGLKGRCPRCGDGKLFSKFLKVQDHCPTCGEEFHHHRADDFPAYIVVLLLGHIMVPFALELERHFSPPFWVHFALTIPMAIAIALVLLQPVKGAIVAIQWRNGMHGFKESKQKQTNI